MLAAQNDGQHDGDRSCEQELPARYEDRSSDCMMTSAAHTYLQLHSIDHLLDNP